MNTLHFLLVIISPLISENKIHGFGSDLLMDQEAEETVVRMERSAIQTCCTQSTRWDDHGNVIPYYFSDSVLQANRKTMRRQMRKIKQNTCLSFREITTGLYPDHVLKFIQPTIQEFAMEAE